MIVTSAVLVVGVPASSVMDATSMLFQHNAANELKLILD